MESWKCITWAKRHLKVGRKAVSIPRRMFVDRPREENKQLLRGRFGLMCFSANRNKLDWDRCECDHINGDYTGDREENVRWLTPKDNKNNYHNKRAPAVSCCMSLAMFGILNLTKTVTAKCLSYQEVNLVVRINRF